MYSVNSIPLDNATQEWTLRSPTKPLSELARDAGAVRVPGVDGVAPGLLGSFDAAVLPFVVRTPRAKMEALLALFYSPGAVLSITGDASRVVTMETLSHRYVGYGAAEADIDVTFMVRLPSVWWRSASTSTSSPAAVSSGSVVVSGFFPGMSAPVQDAIVRVKGSVSGLVVSDHGGSWFSVDGTVGASEWLRFEGSSGRAFITTTDAWVGGTEVSDRVDYGGPRSVFELTPYWSSDPSSRAGRLTVSTSSRSGSPTVEVRGRGAFLV